MDFREFEQHVARIFHRGGWGVETPKQNQVGYDLVVKKGEILGVVQVKWLKANVQKPQISKFVDFLETNEGRQFNCGFFVTTQGYGGPARALIKSWGQDAQIHCGVASENKIIWLGKNEDLPPPKPPKKGKIYFGVFTCKGGVGKTTVSAHLAGAFALQGFNVALVDLDPEQNLQKLVGDGVFVPNPKGVGTTIQVFDGSDWHEDAARDCKIVICDCSPALERNPKELIKQFDYCIIPTTLNPLGINKHGKVIQDTVEKIRRINNSAHLFVLVNNFKDPKATKRMELLKKTFFDAYKQISKTDNKFHCIDPQKVCIRSSDQLYYWGMHILESPDNPRSELAFNLIGGRCHPREDFINLADYIETEAGIGILREKEDAEVN
ncbi:CobQ/CobB/MinD/ParA nucleotide binding domain-containing protein [Cylindrospermum stagnale PCC 7417]|uniref:CobQ/CobB/MinD/ParA nucleotide binding domain-containing protein n=1 Tax=Cylindrospermum stagnale PCC 7417 TaxID=56107 RepID=K9X6R6_9NOST|nr:restriction endonuclease [Cylindrospermum stagnale]AFZ27789.1 CobQ/CobB/MinD/ParA nucleotide binding domain-containing protein [Cylindrospermum stagnale PCC 7417]